MKHAHIEHTHERDGADDVTIYLGHEELMIRRRYETMSILNDLLIGIWFLVGSVAFFFPEWKEAGIWLFVLGSAQLIVRPMIRLAHRIHLRHVPAGRWEL